MGEKWHRLISLREGRSLSQVEVAKALGMSRSGFSMYELGEREPDIETIRKLAVLFSVSTDYLIGRSTDAATGESDPIPPEWRKVITQCRALKLDPDQVLKALSGLSIISEALRTQENEKDR